MNNKIKKVLIKWGIVLLAIGVCVGIVFSTIAIEHRKKINDIDYDIELQGSYNNVILMIGDGMGFNHIEVSEKARGIESLYMERNALLLGECMTFSYNCISPTDSAASATALATGRKVNNGNISKYKDEDIKTNMEIAIEKGMATGIIATEGVDGATPASFSAHADNRNDKEDIISSQLSSNINLFLGSNKDYYDGISSDITAAGYDYINTLDDFDESKSKIFGSFSEVATANGTSETPTLAQLSEIAIEYLSVIGGENGYFLMIEESHIDKFSHSNNMQGMLEHIEAYDVAVETVVEGTKDAGDTLVIVTADHETGGLTIPKKDDYEISDDIFTLTRHTKKLVPYFIFQNIGELNMVIDNTHIGYICNYYINNR